MDLADKRVLAADGGSGIGFEWRGRPRRSEPR